MLEFERKNGEKSSTLQITYLEVYVSIANLAI